MFNPVSITGIVIPIVQAITPVMFKEPLENLGSGLISKLTEIYDAIKKHFQKVQMEGIITPVETTKTPESKTLLEQILIIQMQTNQEFANQILELKKQLEQVEGGRQIMLSGLNLEGDLKGHDMTQKGGKHQEMLTNITANNIDVGNLTQEN